MHGLRLRLDMCTYIISLSKISHQTWCNHPFSQRNKITEWTVEVGVEDGVGVGGKREAGGPNLKKVIWKKAIQGVFIKSGVRNPLPTMALLPSRNYNVLTRSKLKK